ncbi:MAG: polysaccharide deacetylase family protein [Myxococcales bacterium]|nr:polysaccharide deacetylase family protein [Myxococcales bacterium]
MRVVLVALLLCSCRGKPAAPILSYHSVGDDGDEFTVSETAFARQLDWLVAQGIHTSPLRELKGVALTFDDGKEDALTRVVPALQKRGMTGTFFVITGMVGKPGFLSWDGVRALDKAGMEIGSHTVTHPRLADLPDDKVREELVDSKRELEKQLRHPVDLLAYPYNSVRPRVRDAARDAGYRMAVSGAAHGGSDPLDLLRITITRATTMEQFEQILHK